MSAKVLFISLIVVGAGIFGWSRLHRPSKALSDSNHNSTARAKVDAESEEERNVPAIADSAVTHAQRLQGTASSVESHSTGGPSANGKVVSKGEEKKTGAALKQEQAIEKVKKRGHSSDPDGDLFTGKVEGFPPLSPETEVTLAEARKLLGARQVEAARDLLAKAREKNPNDQYLMLEAAMFEGTVMNNPRRAERMFREMVEKFPDSAIGHAALGDYLASHGRQSEATAHLTKAAAGRDAPLQAHSQLGHNLMNRRDFEGASESFSKAYALANDQLRNPSNQGAEAVERAGAQLGQVAVDYGFALMETGRFEEAQGMAAEARRRLGPENAGVQALQEILKRRQSSATTPSPAPSGG